VKLVVLIFISIFVTGCSVFGKSDLETAPYTLLESEKSLDIEVRNYDSIVLVSTSMAGDNGNNAFRKLFKYIGGENEGTTEIAMTAPVLMDDKTESQKGMEISMTAPVLINNTVDTSVMSFVMPSNFTPETTPKPKDPEVRVSELKDYKVAVIQFSGTLSDSNVKKHTKVLTDWIVKNDYSIISDPLKAAYNGPLTLPIMRRNEVLIQIK
jgi:hypothetical protein